MELIRYRWYACDIKGVPSWRFKIYSKHKNIIYKNQKEVVCVILSNNHMLTLDKTTPLRKDSNKLKCSGFLENEKPINGQLACYREEWIIDRT